MLTDIFLDSLKEARLFWAVVGVLNLSYDYARESLVVLLILCRFNFEKIKNRDLIGYCEKSVLLMRKIYVVYFDSEIEKIAE